MRERTDRQSRRSRRLIAEALTALMLEKRYDRITVQQIIDRADVGRSTFYAHYRDKEDVLVSEIERVLSLLYTDLEPPRAGGRHLLPSLGLFRHVEEYEHLYRALGRGHGLAVLHGAIHRALNQSVEQRLAALTGSDCPPTVPLPILVDFVVGAFLHLMHWWVNHEQPYSAEEMDAIFQTLVMPGIQAAT